MKKNCIYTDKYFEVGVPGHPCNSREDGGHLILWLHNPVSDRSDLTVEQAIDYMRISMMVGRAMYDVLDIERMNYEDLGNWGVDQPGGARMHVHFIGRARHQRYQVRGQHFNLIWPKDHPIYKDGTLKPLTDDEVTALRKRVEEISREEKYVRMAKLAGLD